MLIPLQYCGAFAIHCHESATGIHVFPVLNPPPLSLPIPSRLSLHRISLGPIARAYQFIVTQLTSNF